MCGFKSFVKKTELPFTPGINVILGPNGSGKSNVTDALCFVLGRLSMKSMRAAKASNLLFLGTKSVPAAKEAWVEIVFDNSKDTFGSDSDEIVIRRILRKNGQSIYKINGQAKTRQDVLSVLASGGVDPNGFNIILQGEIQNFVKMHADERRKVIEEVAGISIYEARKEKSLRELEKTEEKLKEVLSVLRERTSYLNNLEKERQDALKFKKIEKDILSYKASIVYCDLSKKKKEGQEIDELIIRKNKEIEKIKQSIVKVRLEIENLQTKINEINSTIQKSTGMEQEKLNQEIANLRAELAGLNVKLESSEKKLNETKKRKQELSESIRNSELSVAEMQKASPTIAKRQQELEKKKKELAILEEQRKKFYMTKSELKSIKERIEEKAKLLQSYNNESNYILNEIDNLSKDIFDIRSTREKVVELTKTLEEKKANLDSINKREVELEKIIHTNEYEIDSQNKIIEKISKIDICPLCKSKITPEHIHSIKDEISPKITSLTSEIDSSRGELGEISCSRIELKQEIEALSQEISRRNSDILKLANVEGKKEQVKSLQEKSEEIQKELEAFVKRKKFLESNFDESSNIEQRYETARVEIQEISLATEENVDSEISFKQREIERSKIQLNQLVRDEEDLSEEFASLKNNLKEKEVLLEQKRKKEEELSSKFKKLIEQRDSIQKDVRDKEIEFASFENNLRYSESSFNNSKIDKAKVSAEIENLEIELLEFGEVEIIKSNRGSLQEKLSKAQSDISKIGSVNLRSLEVYDSIKQEYDKIKEKVETITEEKEGILKVIQEIDVRKKRTFLNTFNSLNEIFSRNFAQISTKGEVFLDLENKKEPFSGGVGIVVKTGHGKYFDVNSLSGGEQTMVALSLVFAIQELKPYAFYILDEIDSALDKRNSERLASLLKKYTQKGQYLVISHNDEVISNATNLFGVSMHEGISKVVSMKI